MASRILAGFAIAASLSFTAPAVAADILYDLTPGTVVNSQARTYSGSDGTNTVKLRVSAWSFLNGTTISTATLNSYADGLGVTNRNDSSGSPGHTIDNQGSYDFVLLQFDQAVSLKRANLTPFTGDNDSLVSYYNVASPTTTSTLNLLTNSTVRNGLIANAYTRPSNTVPSYAVNLNPNGFVSNLWIIAADWTNRKDLDDGFKLDHLKVHFVSPAVPEPATWAMMIAGFGMVGIGLRRRVPRAVIA